MLLQNEPEFKQTQRLLDVKGRRSQNWERSGQDKVGKAGLEEFRALQADCDDAELAIRYDAYAKMMHVSLPSPPLPSPPLPLVCECMPQLDAPFKMLNKVHMGEHFLQMLYHDV